MEVRLLGNVAIHGHGEEFRLDRKAERCLLAVLALSPGTGSQLDNLASKVWEFGRAPADSHKTLLTYAKNIRGRITQAGGDPDRLVCDRGAKALLLKIDFEAIDYHRFVTLSTEANRLQDLEPFDRAVSLCTAVPLANLGHEPCACRKLCPCW